MDMLDAGYIAGHILDSTPPVISVGRLVEDCKYQFHWTPRTGPYFDTPSGRRIWLGVEDYIPFFITTDTEKRSDCRRIPVSAVHTAAPAPVATGAEPSHSNPNEQMTDSQEWEKARAEAGADPARCDQPPCTPEGQPGMRLIRSLKGPSPTPDVGPTPVPPSQSGTQLSQTQPFDLLSHIPDHGRNASFPESDRLAFDAVMRDPHPSESLFADVAPPAATQNMPTPPANVGPPASPADPADAPVHFPANAQRSRNRQSMNLKIWRHTTDLDAMPNQFDNFPGGPPLGQVVARCVTDLHTGRPEAPTCTSTFRKKG